MESKLNRNSSLDAKREMQQVVYEDLINFFFDKVIFVNLAYSDLGSGGTTSTTDYGKLSRIIDTAKGQLMAAGKTSMFRCQFYLRNPSKMDGYLLSPAVYDSQSLPGSLTTLSIMRSYVGLKFSGGQVYVAVKQPNEPEKTYEIPFTLTMSDATFTDTFSLEIRHNVNYTDIYLNNTLMGSFESKMTGPNTTDETFYPFFAPARSTDGTLINVVAENLQFIQTR